MGIPLHLTPKSENFALQKSMKFGTKKPETLGHLTVQLLCKPYFNILNCFGVEHECDGRLEGHMDRQNCDGNSDIWRFGKSGMWHLTLFPLIKNFIYHTPSFIKLNYIHYYFPNRKNGKNWFHLSLHQSLMHTSRTARDVRNLRFSAHFLFLSITQETKTSLLQLPV